MSRGLERAALPLPSGHFRRAAASGLLALLLAAAAGCGLFDLREAEKVQSNPVAFDTPTDPWIALRNLRITTAAKATPNFERSMTEDYKFRFDPFDVAEDSLLWSRTEDINALDRMFGKTGTFRLTWSPSDSSYPESGYFYYKNLGYRLVYRRSLSDSVVIQGSCVLYFRQVGQQWLIHRWADMDDGTAAPTWGYARRNPDEVLGS
ncbi:MAG: hypothetical protein FJY88_11910 [Candidatus Eisenbacteria bacterium]|nr:hypothetical protein [Candidatus Eisenbacteria bacterium]